MTAPPISVDLVRAAAFTFAEHRTPDWENLPPAMQAVEAANHTNAMRAALEAALPLLAPQPVVELEISEEEAAGYREQIVDWGPGWDPAAYEAAVSKGMPRLPGDRPALAPQPVVDREALSRAISEELDAEGIVSCGLTPKLVDVVAPLARPLLDREAVKSEVGDTINRRIEFIEDRATVEAAYDAAASAVMELAQPMPTREQIAMKLSLVRFSDDESDRMIELTMREAWPLADAVMALLNGAAK